MPIEQIIGIALDIGEGLLKSGAEINRVEDTICRICTAYGCARTDAFCITSVMIVTVRLPQSHAYTETRRIHETATNLRRLEALNALSRRLCSQPQPYEQVRQELEKIERETVPSGKMRLVGSLLAATTSTLFFGGTPDDLLPCALVAALIFGIDRRFNRGRVNQIVYAFLVSFLSGSVILALYRLGLGQNYDKIMIGNIMLLIPGIALTGSVRDLLGGEIMAGMLRMAESILIAASVAGGFSTAMLALGGVLL